MGFAIPTGCNHLSDAHVNNERLSVTLLNELTSTSSRSSRPTTQWLRRLGNHWHHAMLFVRLRSSCTAASSPLWACFLLGKLYSHAVKIVPTRSDLSVHAEQAVPSQEDHPSDTGSVLCRARLIAETSKRQKMEADIAELKAAVEELASRVGRPTKRQAGRHLRRHRSSYVDFADCGSVAGRRLGVGVCRCVVGL